MPTSIRTKIRSRKICSKNSSVELCQQNHESHLSNISSCLNTIRVFLNGPFPTSFLYFHLFYKQLTVNKCSIKVADDWIQTRVLWYRKRPLCQLRHNHFPPFVFLSQFDPNHATTNANKCRPAAQRSVARSVTR